MKFKEIVNNRHAVRSFDGKRVPENKVNELLDIIRHAPSSYNIQPWKIKIITDQAMKEKLAPVSWNQPQVTTCSHLLVFCADTDIAGNVDKIEKSFKEKGLPLQVIQMMRDFEKGMSAEQKKSWSQRQLYLALGNALNGATSLGFDSCPMEGFIPAEYSKILKLPSNLVPTVLCAIGYSTHPPRDKMRFSKEEITF
jgi:nitroreductase